MIKLLIIPLFALIALAGCKTAKVLPDTVPIRSDRLIHDRLVPLISPADSANLQALFECDSSKQVVLRQLSEANSRGIKTKYSFNNGLFSYAAMTVHDTIYVPVTDSTLRTEVPVYVNVPGPEVRVPGPEVNKLTTFQKIQIKTCNMLFVLLGIGIGLFLVRKKFPFIMKLLKWLTSLF